MYNRNYNAYGGNMMSDVFKELAKSLGKEILKEGSKEVGSIVAGKIKDKWGRKPEPLYRGEGFRLGPKFPSWEEQRGKGKKKAHTKKRKAKK